MTEPKHPGQKPAMYLKKPEIRELEYLSKDGINAVGTEIPIPEGATHVSFELVTDMGCNIACFFREKNKDASLFESELAAFYSELDNHRKELAQWEEGMAKWNIYQKEMQIAKLEDEIHQLYLKRSSLTDQKEGV